VDLIAMQNMILTLAKPMNRDQCSTFAQDGAQLMGELCQLARIEVIADFTQYNQIRTDLQIEIPQIGTLDAYIVVPTASLPSPADRARRDVRCENLLAA
jgi:hypothetical protein